MSDVPARKAQSSMSSKRCLRSISSVNFSFQRCLGTLLPVHMFKSVHQAQNEARFESRPCQVLYFFKHTLVYAGYSVPHFFAFVQWLKPYPQEWSSFSNLDPSLHIYQRSFAAFSKECIVPVHRQYAGVGVQILDSNACAIMDLPRKIKVSDH